MKKLFSLFIMVFTLSLTACDAKGNKLEGKYLTEEYNTQNGEEMTQVTYTFTKDSLYIDAYPSGCGITALALEWYSDKSCTATETITDINGDGKEVAYIRIYHISFVPCEWDKNEFAVFRDYKVVDIIKKF